MIKSKKPGSRRGRAALAGAIVATAAIAFGATSANAATAVFSASFDDAALNLPVLGTSDVLNPPPPATMTGTVADDSQDPANFTVPQTGFVFPSFSGDANGVTLTVSFEATAPITGTVSPTTGSVTTGASAYKATVSALGTSCVYNLTRSLTTGPGSPFNGDPFTVDKTTTPGTWSLNQGILQAGWPSLPASGAGGACDTIDSIITSGPGGLEMGNGFDLTPGTSGPGTPPPATASPTCKGKPATIIGTDGNDVRKGTPGKDVIVGLRGNDKLSGLAGNDLICGGAGKDTLNGGKGNDKLFGQAGTDTLKGGPGKDKLKGGAGKDKQIP
jgi:Ca2+-binding RTX toxin-like protein